MLVPPADAAREPADPEETPDGEAADRHDQPRSQELQLPVAPEGAELLLARRRRPVTAPRGRATGITAGDGRAVERGVELFLVQLEPASECPAGATSPGTALGALDHARRLAVHVGALAHELAQDRQRLERKAPLGAGTADPEVTLQRSEGAIRGAPARQARTTRNQRPSKTISPPSSSARSAPANTRL